MHFKMARVVCNRLYPKRTLPYYILGEIQYVSKVVCPNSQNSLRSEQKVPGRPTTSDEILKCAYNGQLYSWNQPNSGSNQVWKLPEILNSGFDTVLVGTRKF